MKSKLVLNQISLDNFQVRIPVVDSHSFERIVKRVNDLSLAKGKRDKGKVLESVQDVAELVSQVGSAVNGSVAVGGLVGIALQLVLKTSLAVAKTYAKHHDIQALTKAIDSSANACKGKDYAKAVEEAINALREVDNFNKHKVVGFLTNRDSEFSKYKFALRLLLQYNLAAAYYGQFVQSGKTDLTLIQGAVDSIDKIYRALQKNYIDISAYLKDVHNDLHLVHAVVKSNEAINAYNNDNLAEAKNLSTGLSFDYGYYSFDAKQRAKAGEEYHDDQVGLAICDVLKANVAQFRLIPRDEIEQQFNDSSVSLSLN